jgi:transposase
MGAVHYKVIRGIEYAYDVRSYWSKEEKKNKKETTYLGRVIDKKNGVYAKTRKKTATRKQSEKLILNFGDTYCIYQAFSQTEYFNILADVFKERFDTLMCLVCYRIIRDSAMRYAENWFEGNYARILFKKTDISSPRISDFLKILGDEGLQRDFFTAYLSLLANKSVGTLIDSTGLPNEIDFPLNAWGHHGNSTESETRLLYVVDRNTGMPVYFRYMPGNIVDVSTLSNTIAEMKQFGINTDFAIVDAGYYSENNVKALYGAKVNFLTRLPSNRKMFKNLITLYGGDMEKSENVVIYGERVLFVRCVPVDLFNRPGFAYVVFDPKRYADESRKYLIEAKGDKKSDSDIDEGLKFKGKLIFIASFKVAEPEIIPLYYTRQSVENLFGIMKNDLEILPLRVHSVETFRGYLLLNFIALLVRLSLQRQLDRKYTVEDVIYSTHNLMCKVYDKQIVVQELTKKCSDIFKLLHIKVVNSLGV